MTRQERMSPAALKLTKRAETRTLDLQRADHARRVEWERALELLRGGAQGIEQWNRWRATGKPAGALARCRLVGADLSDADLRGCDLRGAHLRGAVLFGARLDDADLGKADLRGTELSHASLVRARLAGANLKKARLFSADLRQAKLERVNLSQAEADASTRWPDGFFPKQRGVDFWPD